MRPSLLMKLFCTGHACLFLQLYTIAFANDDFWLPFINYACVVACVTLCNL